MNEKIPTALAGLFAFSLSLFVHALSSPLSFSQRRPSQSAALTLIHSVLVSSDFSILPALHLSERESCDLWTAFAISKFIFCLSFSQQTYHYHRRQRSQFCCCSAVRWNWNSRNHIFLFEGMKFSNIFNCLRPYPSSRQQRVQLKKSHVISLTSRLELVR